MNLTKTRTRGDFMHVVTKHTENPRSLCTFRSFYVTLTILLQVNRDGEFWG